MNLKRTKHGYLFLAVKFAENVPTPLDECMRTHIQRKFEGIPIEIYRTGFQVLHYPESKIKVIGELIENMTVHKPSSFIKKVIYDLDKFEMELGMKR